MASSWSWLTGTDIGAAWRPQIRRGRTQTVARYACDAVPSSALTWAVPMRMATRAASRTIRSMTAHSAMARLRS